MWAGRQQLPNQFRNPGYADVDLTVKQGNADMEE